MSRFVFWLKTHNTHFTIVINFKNSICKSIVVINLVLMNNEFSPEQTAKTGDLNADLILRQNKLYKIAKFMEIKSNNPGLKQSETAKELAISTSTLQRYRREIYMHSPY